MSGYVQSAKASTSSGTSLGIALTGVASGDDLLLGWWFGNTGATYSAMDTLNAGSYAADAQATLATDGDDMGVMRKSASAAGNVTTTFSETGLAANSIRLTLTEALLATTPFDKKATNNATGTAATTGNTPSTAQASEFLFGVIGTAGAGGSNTIAATGGQTARQTVLSGSEQRFQSADRTVAATGAYAATWTLSASQEYGAVICTYKLPGGTAYTMTASPGSYALTGQPATAPVARKLVANAGALAITGQPVTAPVGRRMTAAPGTYQLMGAPATLTYSGGATAYTLIASPGSYALTGAPATLPVGRRLIASPGTLVLSGAVVAGRVARVLAAAPGTYALTGRAVQGRLSWRLSAAPGAFVLTGLSAVLTMVSNIYHAPAHQQHLTRSDLLQSRASDAAGPGMRTLRAPGSQGTRAAPASEDAVSGANTSTATRTL